MSKYNRILINENNMERNINKVKIIRSIFITIFSGIGLILTGQADSEGNYPQYHFPEFSKATILLKNGKSQSIVMNYNIVTEKLVYEKDDNYYDLLNPETIDTVFINESKFMPVGKTFHELLLKGTKLALFVQYKGDLMPPGKPAGYGGTSQLSATTSLSSIELAGMRYNIKLPSGFNVNATKVYWIRKENNMVSFSNEKQFLKLFPDKEKELKLYIKENKIKFDKPVLLIKLVSYCNELMN